MNSPINSRRPEAQAKELAVVLASSTEYHLATLEQLLMRKSSSKSDICRQQVICDKLVFHCFELDVKPLGLRGFPCIRLEEHLVRLHNDPTELNELQRRISHKTTV